MNFPFSNLLRNDNYGLRRHCSRKGGGADGRVAGGGSVRSFVRSAADVSLKQNLIELNRPLTPAYK